MAKREIIVVILILSLIAGSLIYLSYRTSQVSKTPINVGEIDKTFSLTAKNFRFYMDGVESPELRVKEGDKIRIELVSEQGFHDWVLDEFNAKTSQINAPASSFVEFIVDKKGTFEYYCSVGQHRINGMKGVFIVE